MEPFIEITPEVVSQLLNTKILVDPSTAKLLGELKESFFNRNGKQPSIDETRHINVACYALSKTGQRF